MVFELCSGNNKTELYDFYRNVSVGTENMSIYGKWNYSVYPTDEIISDYIDNSQMYYMKNDKDIYGAVALTIQKALYHDKKWNATLRDEEVMVAHALAVNPQYQHQGVGHEMMSEVISLAKKMNMKAVRLDALSCNIPAHKLYEDMGFLKCDVGHWYAPNTGWADWYTFELLL